MTHASGKAAASALDNFEEHDRMPGGWWILPAAVIGLAGWIGIFYALGLL